MNEQKIYNEILRESSIDTKYKSMEESKNKDVKILVAVVVGIIIGILIA